MELGYYKLRETAEDPVFGTTGSACFDVKCDLFKNKIKYYTSTNTTEPHIDFVRELALPLYPGYRYMIPTGLIFDIPEGYSLRGHIRSSAAIKKGLMMCNNEAIIDSDYVNEVFLLITNTSNSIVTIEHNERIAQFELVKSLEVYFKGLKEPPSVKTDRMGGLGSTGR